MTPAWMLKEHMQETIGRAYALVEHGIGLYNTWTKLAFSEPPKDIIGRIIWTLGVLGQLILSAFTFPAAIASFLMEESVQTAGMGAYMLATAKRWDLLDEYLPLYLSHIIGAETATKTLASINPISGGAVIAYMQAAELSWNAFRKITDTKLLEQAEKDRKTREMLLEQQKYGELRLTSVPSQAEIWIDGENTELLTPETFKKIPAGHHVIELRYYNTKTQDWDILVFEIDIEPGRRKEIRAHIPQKIQSTQEGATPPQETDTPRLPKWITAEVTGDHAIDGDTFITTQGEHIRLLAINAPELDQPYGELAKEYLNQQIQDKKIQLRIQTHKPLDGYGRTLAICKNYKGDISLMLLTAGLARTLIMPDDIYDPTKYTEAENNAKTRRIGIWSQMP